MGIGVSSVSMNEQGVLPLWGEDKAQAGQDWSVHFFILVIKCQKICGLAIFCAL
jgi:hypothetical protein